MRTPLPPVAVIVSLALSPAAFAGVTAKVGPPPPSAPIFYCPKAMAAPQACPATGHANRRHNRVHAHRVVRIERRVTGEDRGVSASQAWVYGYELGRGGLPLREGVGRGYAMGGHGMEHGRRPYGHPDALARRNDDGRRGVESGGLGERRHVDDRQDWRDHGREFMGRGGDRRFAGESGEAVRSGGWSWRQDFEGHGDLDEREVSTGEEGGREWRYGQGGGYEVYHTAGRDRDGYLVWAGKPRL